MLYLRYKKGNTKEINTMTTFKMTYHASVERIDRLTACIQYLGFNEFVCEMPDPMNPGTAYCVTDTGIIIIKAIATNTIITGYMATPKRIAAIFKGNTPPALYKRVVKNNKKYAFLLTM
jgi:hypothetical protein